MYTTRGKPTSIHCTHDYMYMPYSVANVSYKTEAFSYIIDECIALLTDTLCNCEAKHGSPLAVPSSAVREILSHRSERPDIVAQIVT